VCTCKLDDIPEMIGKLLDAMKNLE
jgi:hypothetical protein